MYCPEENKDSYIHSLIAGMYTLSLGSAIYSGGENNDEIVELLEKAYEEIKNRVLRRK